MVKDTKSLEKIKFVLCLSSMINSQMLTFKKYISLKRFVKITAVNYKLK